MFPPSNTAVATWHPKHPIKLIMRKINLVDRSGCLSPLAPFVVLSVMCHPTNRSAQRRMRTLIEGQTRDKPTKRPRLTDDEFVRQVELSASRGGAIAGGLLLNMIQLHLRQPPASVNQAIKMLLYLLPRWEQPKAAEWHEQQREIRIPKHRPRILDAFSEFLPVAHLWAALVYSLENERSDIAPDSRQTLPTFIGYASAFAELASRVPFRSKKGRFLLPASVPKRFIVPEHSEISPQLLALALHRKQLEAIGRYESL